MEKPENESQYENLKKGNVLSSLNHVNTIGFIKDGRGQRLQNVSYKVGFGIPTSYKLQNAYDEATKDLDELKKLDKNHCVEQFCSAEDYHNLKFLSN
jgi:hypothetical protein